MSKSGWLCAVHTNVVIHTNNHSRIHANDNGNNGGYSFGQMNVTLIGDMKQQARCSGEREFVGRCESVPQKPSLVGCIEDGVWSGGEVNEIWTMIIVPSMCSSTQRTTVVSTRTVTAEMERMHLIR